MFLTLPSLEYRCFTPVSTDLFSNGNLFQLTFYCKADTAALQLLHLEEQQWKHHRLCVSGEIYGLVLLATKK